MSDENKTVVDFFRAGARQRELPSDDQLWPAICRNAIFPAFRLCQDHLLDQGVEAEICEVTNKDRPFTVLFWEARKGLRGVRLGLHFTYGGRGRLCFDLSAVRLGGGYHHQTSYYQEYFYGDEADLGSKVLRRASMGLGIAFGLDEMPVSTAQWRSKKIEAGRLH